MSITGHLIGVENSVNFVGTLRFRGGKRSFGFKRLLELVWTVVNTSFIDRRNSFTLLQASHAKQPNKIRLLKVLFVKKLLLAHVN